MPGISTPPHSSSAASPNLPPSKMPTTPAVPQHTSSTTAPSPNVLTAKSPSTPLTAALVPHSATSHIDASTKPTQEKASSKLPIGTATGSHSTIPTISSSSRQSEVSLHPSSGTHIASGIPSATSSSGDRLPPSVLADPGKGHSNDASQDTIDIKGAAAGFTEPHMFSLMLLVVLTMMLFGRHGR